MKNSSTKTSSFDRLIIHDYAHQEIPVSHIVPVGYDKYLIPGSNIYSATGSPGIFLFQEMPYPLYSFLISNYFGHDGKKITGNLRDSTLELHVLLENNLMYRLKGFDWQPLKETQYNLLFVPEVQNEVYFDKKNYFSFDIYPSLELLKKISRRCSALKNFLKLVQQGSCARYYEDHPYASASMLFLIKQIIEFLTEKSKVHINLNETVEQLIHLALTAPLQADEMHFSFYDIERLWEAEQEMIQSMDESDILDKVLHKTNLQVSKFRKGFSQVFGDTPHHYLHRKRMEKAWSLVKSKKRISIKNISSQVGYSSSNNFSTAYKNYFGINPENDRAQNS